jgi:thioredoxin-dependent peroxiredoxin
MIRTSAAKAATALRNLCLVAGVGLAFALPASAALKVGDKAPDFMVQAAKNGNVARFALKDALKKGPVVVYFFPKAFTTGCSLEAHEFSEAMDQFTALKVSVIGISADNIPTLMEFSKKDCQGRFPVGSDPQASVAESFDAKSPTSASAKRISYLIKPDGTIVEVTDSGDPTLHIKEMLAAAKTLK